MSAKPFVAGPADFRKPPYSFENITTITLSVAAQGTSQNPAPLQKICDDFLNTPLGRTAANRFEPFGSEVLLTFASFPEAESVSEPAVGYLTYQEVSLLFTVYDNKNHTSGMYAPLLFLDGPDPGTAEYFASPPILLGRELFGLPKVRGEIEFNRTHDLTGTLRCIFPSANDVVMSLGDSIRVSMAQMLFLMSKTQELEDLETQIRRKPNSGELKKRRLALFDARRRASRKVARVRQEPIFGKRHHPFEVVNKLWGPNVVSLLRRGMDVPQKVAEGLDLVRAQCDEDALEEAVELATKSGFFAALSMTATTLGFPLIGFRQLHNPITFGNADHQAVILSPFDYSSLPLQTTNTYIVDFFSQDMRDWLGLATTYTVAGSDMLTFNGADAVYGDPLKTQVITS